MVEVMLLQLLHLKGRSCQLGIQQQIEYSNLTGNNNRQRIYQLEPYFQLLGNKIRAHSLRILKMIKHHCNLGKFSQGIP